MRTVTLILLLGVAAPAWAQSYLPLPENGQWTYGGLQGQFVQRSVAGTQVVGGETTIVLANVRSQVFDDEWRNFWTTDAQGRVLLHGFRNLTTGIGVRYDPPIVWIDPAQSSWSTLTIAYDLDTDVSVGNLDAQISSIADVSINVPAGTFDTLLLDVQIQSLDPAGALGEGLDALGQRRSDPDANKRADHQLWYARGVGLVRESFCCPLTIEELTSYQVVATGSYAWGDVKSWYAR